MMPNRRIEFIGRQREIEFISQLVFDWGTKQALFISGPGGVGKTSLLRAVHRQVRDEIASAPQSETRKQVYRVLDIVDLDDIRRRSSFDISSKIIDQVGAENFATYIQELKEFRRLERTSLVRASEQKRKLEETFIRCYTNASLDVRTVILCDTTDVLETAPDQEIVDFLYSLCCNFGNTFILFSGRNSEDLFNRFKHGSGSACVHLLPIGPLEPETGRLYLRHKQESLHIAIDPEIAQKILFLSKELPLLIDLAVEWLARDMPLSWLIREPLEALKLMPEEEAREVQTDFETRLVQHIAQLRNPLDRLVLALARIHPVDAMLCARLLDLSEEQAGELMANACALPIVKNLPDGRIKLHDYVEGLVLQYVWPGMEEERKKQDSDRAAQYHEGKLRELRKQLDTLSSKLDDSRTETIGTLNVYLTKEALEREYWQIGAQLLEHALFVDANRGAQIFCDLFDEAFNLQRVSALDQMIVPVMGYEEELLWGTRFEVDIRHAKTLARQRKYSAAEEVVNGALRNKSISPEQRIEALLSRGNIRMRLRQKGPVQAGLDDFLEAIQIADTNGLPKALGQAELGVGWAYSSIGDWNKANDHFQEALELALEVGNKELEATVLNELAYTMFYVDPGRARALCSDAIEMWIELGDKYGLGRSYSNMGTILYRAANYDEAKEYFQKAGDIFESLDAPEWIGIVSSWQGITCCAQVEKSSLTPGTDEQLREAEQLVRRAIDTDVHLYRAQNLNRLARIYASQGRYDDAWHQLWSAYDASVEIGDFVYEIASLRDLSSIALESERFDFYDTLKTKLARFEEQGILPGGPGYGGALLNIGVMGIYCGDSESGFDSIARGLEYSAKSGSYASHNFVGTLEALQRHVVNLVAPSERRELANFLIRYWDDKKLSRTYIEATRMFYKLKQL